MAAEVLNRAAAKVDEEVVKAGEEVDGFDRRISEVVLRSSIMTRFKMLEIRGRGSVMRVTSVAGL